MLKQQEKRFEFQKQDFNYFVVSVKITIISIQQNLTKLDES